MFCFKIYTEKECTERQRQRERDTQVAKEKICITFVSLYKEKFLLVIHEEIKP